MGCSKMKVIGRYRLAATIVKANAHYVCQECGSTELIQAHHQTPDDDSTLISLCASCHSKKHPDVPLGLFFSGKKQPYWENKSAASLAKELGVHSRTIIRNARKLNLSRGTLSVADEFNLRNLLVTNKYIYHKPNNPKQRARERYYEMKEKAKELLCPECGSEKLIKWGKRFVRQEGKRVKTQQFQCKSCGRISIKPVEGKQV